MGKKPGGVYVIKPVYLCDPFLNRECTKESCGIYCKNTLHKEFSRRNEKGEPIIAEYINILDGVIPGRKNANTK